MKPNPKDKNAIENLNTYVYNTIFEQLKNMEVNNKLIQDIAKLSKLEFNKSSNEKMKKDLKKILAFVDKLNEIDTENIEPLVYLSEEENVLRPDQISKSLTQKQALINAPQKDSDYFKVPTVLKK